MIFSVRCGSLAAVERRHDPRVCLGGAAWSKVAPQPNDCPAKGQPLLSTSGGFSLARMFCGASVSNSERDCWQVVVRPFERVGPCQVAAKSLTSNSGVSGAKWSGMREAGLGAPQNTCSDRTPRVSSGPVSAARKERPALLHPKASRGACQRGTPDAIPASGEDKRDVRSESLPLGALGGCFVLAAHDWIRGASTSPRSKDRHQAESVRSGEGSPQSTQSILWARADSLGYHPWGTYGETMIGLPGYIDPDAWQGFEDMRRTIKKPLTDRARKLIVYELDRIKKAGHCPNAALDQSTNHCWADVYEPRDKTIQVSAGHAYEATRQMLDRPGPSGVDEGLKRLNEVKAKLRRVA